MNKKQQIEKEIFELIGDAYTGNSVATVNAMEAACKLLDYKFGEGFHKQHPELAVQMTETIMSNARTNDFKSAIKNGIGEYLDALRIVIFEKTTELTGSISVDIPDTIKVDG